MPAITGAHHLALTVSDADRSASWYSDLLGMHVVLSGGDSANYTVSQPSGLTAEITVLHITGNFTASNRAHGDENVQIDILVD